MDSLIGSGIAKTTSSSRGVEPISAPKTANDAPRAARAPVRAPVKASTRASFGVLTARAYRPTSATEYKAMGRAWAAKGKVPKLNVISTPSTASNTVASIKAAEVPQVAKQQRVSGAPQAKKATSTPGVRSAVTPDYKVPKAAVPEASLPKPAMPKPVGPSLRAVRALAPIDTRVIAGDPGGTVGKLRPLRDSLKTKVGNLSMGQRAALVDSSTKTAAAHAASVHRQMNETKRSQDIGRRRYAAQVKNQQRHSMKMAEKLKVKFDSVPEHLREFAAKAGKEVTVPGADGKTPLERMLGNEGVVEFRGPGRIAIDKYLAAQ